jgi:hypothetical protein
VKEGKNKKGMRKGMGIPRRKITRIERKKYVSNIFSSSLIQDTITYFLTIDLFVICRVLKELSLKSSQKNDYFDPDFPI